jgi:hypothetical protein
MHKHTTKEAFHAYLLSYKKHKTLQLGLIGVISFLILLSSVFFVTRGSIPSSSELSYIEHSSLVGSVGSVVPASCESGYEHTAGECFCYGNTSCGVCGNAACCVANTGAACTSNQNSCGDVNNGTIQCNGSCSVSSTAPAERPNWNSVCSPANVCGRTNTGNIQCNGSCSVAAPSNNTCIPTSVTISASPNVGAGKLSTINWSSANSAAGCEIVKRTFVNAGDTGGDVATVRSSVGPSGTIQDGPLPVPTTVQGQSIASGQGYYVAYKARCWDSSGTMYSGYSSEAVTTVGSARLWFTP